MAMSGEPKVAESRLSSLPDDIIAHILSFLETKYAVGTAVLSRRWKDLWTRVSHLDFDHLLLYKEFGSSDDVANLPLFEMQKRMNLKFSRFVDRVLSQHRNLDSLRRFRLRYFPWYINCNVVEDFVDKMGLIFGSQVEEIDIAFRLMAATEPWPLPESFYTMKNLKVAKLDGFTMAEIGNESVSLPCLKILQLRSVQTEDFESLGRLISGCPVLESLRLEHCFPEERNEEEEEDLLLTGSLTSLRNLRNLTIIDYPEIDHCLGHIAMEAPNLEHLYLANFVELQLLGSSSPLPCLYSAEICTDGRGDSYQGLISLLTRISNAKKMCFNGIALEILASAGEGVELPVFPNLTHLEVKHSGGSLSLHTLLQSAPKLQSLVIDVGSGYAPLRWEETEPTCPPQCLLSSIEEIQIIGFRPLEQYMNMVEYLLNAGAILKKLDINKLNSITKGDREQLRSLLKKLPRESSACEVRLLLHGKEMDDDDDEDQH